jgi:hypothetical protein
MAKWRLLATKAKALSDKRSEDTLIKAKLPAYKALGVSF